MQEEGWKGSGAKGEHKRRGNEFPNVNKNNKIWINPNWKYSSADFHAGKYSVCREIIIVDFCAKTQLLPSSWLILGGGGGGGGIVAKEEEEESLSLRPPANSPLPSSPPIIHQEEKGKFKNSSSSSCMRWSGKNMDLSIEHFLAFLPRLNSFLEQEYSQFSLSHMSLSSEARTIRQSSFRLFFCERTKKEEEENSFFSFVVVVSVVTIFPTQSFNVQQEREREINMKSESKTTTFWGE